MKSKETSITLTEVLQKCLVLNSDEVATFELKRKISKIELEELQKAANSRGDGHEVSFSRSGHTLKALCKRVFEGVNAQI